MAIQERNIDDLAYLLIDALSDAVLDCDGEMSAIFSATATVLCSTTSPGYTDQQGIWYNTLIQLLRDADPVIESFGCPHWMQQAIELTHTLGVLED